LGWKVMEGRGRDCPVGHDSDLDAGVVELLDGEWIADPEAQPDHGTTASRWLELEQLGGARARGVGRRAR